MGKRKKVLLSTSALLVTLISGAVIVNFVLSQDDTKPQSTRQQEDVVSQSTEPAIEPSQTEENSILTINYGEDGYQPRMLQVKKGQTVKFTTTSEVPNWVASNPHPAHTDYPEFDTGQILGTLPAPGDETEFTFDKVGGWGFHNHNQQGHTGTIVVTE
ncbi:MAG: hypothetical protein H6799_02955 [Candidatus Nomurabacteria bacterium]|nr:MAG: hypothetical protein H6799_02955 [Candidatus Nomurabacteria bacterium]